MAERYDAVIVGSGFGGAIAALRLAEDGRRVIVLERGRRLGEGDLRQSHDVRYLASIYSTVTKADGAVFFRSARLVGGGSVLFAGAMPRTPSESFAFEDEAGRVWPEGFDRALLDPFYARVEAALGVRQIRWDEVPKTGGAFARLCAEQGLRCDRVPFCYEGCRQCGFCSSGCIFGAKTTLLDTYIPQAEARGAVVRAEAEVTSLRPLRDGRYAVTYLEPSGQARNVEGDLVCLAGGALATPAILLRSAPSLPGLSDQVGQNLCNNGDLGIFIEMPRSYPSVDSYKGRENTGIMLYEFWAEHRFTFHPGLHPLALFGAVEVHPEGMRPFGLEHKRWVRSAWPRRVIAGLCMGLVKGEGRVTLSSVGLPTVEFSLTEAIRAHMARCEAALGSIVEPAGGRLLRTHREGYEYGDAHSMGSCRMADSPERGPCDRNGEVFGWERLFVVDSATLSGPLGVNPALTVAANAERISDFMVASR